MKTKPILLILAGAAAILAGCGGSAPSSAAIGHGSARLSCRSNPFIGTGPGDWRRDSWSFAGFGMSRNFAVGEREPDGLLRGKAPMIVEGPRTVVLRVPRSEAGRVGIEIVHAARPLSTLTLEPCADRKRTIWAAGLALRDRRPVLLEVRIGARTGEVRIGPPEPPP